MAANFVLNGQGEVEDCLVAAPIIAARSRVMVKVR